MLSQEQIIQRKSFITGSDAAIICGLSPYKNKIQLFLEKTGQVEPEDISDNPYVRAGNYLEDAIRDWFSHESGYQVFKKNELIVHKDLPWMAGNIDGRIILTENPCEDYILEVKTASRDDGWGILGDDKTIPEHYLLQVAHYCAITDTEVCFIAVLFRGVDFRIYRYDRNRVLEAKLIERERIFWEEHVLKNICPEPCTAQEVRSMKYDILGDVAISTVEIEEYVNRLKELKSAAKMIEEEQEELKDKICMSMQDKSILLNQFGEPLATWKYSKAAKRFDAKKLEKELPKIYEKYCYMATPARPLVIK